MGKVASIRISVRVGRTDAQGIALARVFHGRRKVEEFETTQAEMRELAVEASGATVPDHIRAASEAARLRREELGRTYHMRVLASIRFTMPLGCPQPTF
ncbi:MAG: hypothetical protein K2X44_05945 [Magnetospirillum sp.]|nr:hypothetical protein [Magnetospirillum sp.]